MHKRLTGKTFSVKEKVEEAREGKKSLPIVIADLTVFKERWNFSGGTSGKEPTCQYRRHKRCGFDPWVGKIPWGRAWQPSAVFLPGESHGQRSLAG